jgi:hypothetical protein
MFINFQKLTIFVVGAHIFYYLNCLIGEGVSRS